MPNHDEHHDYPYDDNGIDTDDLDEHDYNLNAEHDDHDSVLTDADRDAARAFAARLATDHATGLATVDDVLRAIGDYAHFQWECHVFWGDDHDSYPAFEPAYARELAEHDALN